MQWKHGAVWINGGLLCIMNCSNSSPTNVQFKCASIPNYVTQFLHGYIYSLNCAHTMITILFIPFFSLHHIMLISLFAHCYSSHSPNCSFNMTRTCHLGVVGDSHTTNVVVGCCRHLASTSCAVTGDIKKQRIYFRGFAWICMNFQRDILWVKSEMRFPRLDVTLVFVDFVSDYNKKSVVVVVFVLLNHKSIIICINTQQFCDLKNIST